MTAPKLSDLRHEYEDLFNTCVITKPVPVQEVVNTILKNENRYESVAKTSNVPWFVIAAIHNMECSLDFRQHLHNGDPLSKKTVDVPAGRPPIWDKTRTWEESALDALSYDNLTSWTDWSIAGICYELEAYNGWGYRRHGIHTPYLWSFTNHYTGGKYTADGVWSESAVSDQCGCAAVLRRLAELGKLTFSDQPIPQPNMPPAVSFSEAIPADPAVVAAAKALQRWLSNFSGIFLAVDGIIGKRTSDAFKLVTGHYLFGDPRGKS
jgi:lysozyme family protein